MKVKIILVIFWGVLFVSCDNRTIEESEIFLKEFEGSQRVWELKSIFRRNLNFIQKLWL